MNLDAALGNARALAESLMTSTCTAFTPGENLTDPQTGEVTQVQDVAWFGPCRVRPNGATQASAGTAGGAEVFTFDYIVSIPFAVDAVHEGQRLTITASPDPALVGLTLEIQMVARGDAITARRLACTEVV